MSGIDELSSELGELANTKNIATVENYRYFITCDGKDFIDDEKRIFLLKLYRSFISSLSLREQFAIASELITEIDMYNEVVVRRISTPEQRGVLFSLYRSFEFYEGIEREEYLRLFEMAPLSIINSLSNNRSFPLEFLVDPSLLEARKAGLAPMDLEYYIHYARLRRKVELVARVRQLVPNSAHMSDEMVLSVAGIAL